MDEPEQVELEFEINKDILDSAEFPAEQFLVDLEYLGETIGDTILNITPTEIADLNLIRMLHYLAESFAFFEETESTDRLIQRFKSPPEAQSHIPTVFFSRYILGDLGEIEFEPDGGDLILTWRDTEILFEFKRPRESQEVQEYREQHKQKLDDIKEILDTRFQYDIRYEVPHDIEVLFPLLEDAVSKINGPGKTLLSGTTELTARESGGFNEVSPIDGFIMDIWMLDKDSGEWRPLTQYSGQDATFSIAGPKIDERDKLDSLIDTARRQLEKERPTIIAIHIGNLMGSISDLKRRAQGLFKGSENTRINAIILFDHSFPSVEGGLQFTTRTIRNPYAESPIPEGFFDNLSDLNEEILTD